MYSAVIFDLDGTLVDTSPDLCEATNKTLAHIGRTPLDHSIIRGLVGNGAAALIGRGLEHTGGAAGVDTKALLSFFLDYYSRHIADHSRPYPDCLAVLNLLHARGIPIGLCTNKPEALARKLLDALNMSHHFTSLAGGDTYSYRKPDPQHILSVMQGLSVTSPQQCLMVGDSLPDAAAAQAAHMPCALLRHGYSDTPIDAVPASYRFDTLAGLLAHLKAVL